MGAAVGASATAGAARATGASSEPGERSARVTNVKMPSERAATPTAMATLPERPSDRGEVIGVVSATTASMPDVLCCTSTVLLVSDLPMDEGGVELMFDTSICCRRSAR